MRIAEIVYDSVVDGEGLRNVLFVQGCPHRCEGCHNPSTWDTDGGTECGVEVLTEMLTSNLRPVTISGGEPFNQFGELIDLTRELKKLGVPDIWVYTGYDLEYLRSHGSLQLIESYIDVIVDGRYDQSRPPALFRGSDNQRIWRKDVLRRWRIRNAGNH